MTETLPGYITAAGTQAANAAGTAGEMAADVYTVGDLLQKKIADAYNYNSDIVNQLDTNTQGYFSAPSEARVNFQNIFNPFQRENLVSQYVGNKAKSMLSSANILGARIGGVEDLARSGIQGFQSLVAKQQAKAEAAQRNYENLLKQFQIEQELNAVSAQEMEINGRRYWVTVDRNGNIKSKVDLGPAKKTGGSDMFGGLFDMFTIDANGNLVLKSSVNNTGGGLGPKPTYTPDQETVGYTLGDKVNVSDPFSQYAFSSAGSQILDPTGTWIWSPSANNWTPRYSVVTDSLSSTGGFTGAKINK